MKQRASSTCCARTGGRNLRAASEAPNYVKLYMNYMKHMNCITQHWDGPCGRPRRRRRPSAAGAAETGGSGRTRRGNERQGERRQGHMLPDWLIILIQV